jgi:hypothetical protein
MRNLAIWIKKKKKEGPNRDGEYSLLFACFYFYIPAYILNMSVLGNLCAKIALFVANLAQFAILFFQ